MLKQIHIEPSLCHRKDFKSSVIKVVDSSRSSLSANSICSNTASEDGFHLDKRRKMDEEYNSLQANGNIIESMTGSLAISECNSSPAQDGDGKSLMVSSSVEIPNSGPNSFGYKGDHDMHEEASVGNHLRNSAGSHSGVNNGLQSSTSSMPSYINHGIEDEDDWEYSPPDADATRDFCISILRDELPTKGSVEIGQKSLLNDDKSSPLFKCKSCESMEDPFKMIICDCCEGAFHLSCCKPRVQEVPEEKWCCQVCSRKKPQWECKKFSQKHELLPKPIQRLRRGLGTIQDMLVDDGTYQTSVRIGKDFQADVPEWSGPIPSNEDQFDEPSELDPSEMAMVDLTQFKGKKSSMGNWIQCREVLDTGIVCGKWRRVPLHVEQSKNWDCSCLIVSDPFRADCAVPQELETDEILHQLKFIKKLKGQLNRSKKGIKRKNRSKKEP